MTGDLFYFVVMMRLGAPSVAGRVKPEAWPAGWVVPDSVEAA
jgi:hypothetical protein